jgi:HEAT repeat protein
MSALRALRKVGDGRAVEPLAALLDDRRTQLPATIALGRIGDERAWRPVLVIQATRAGVGSGSQRPCGFGYARPR